MAIAALLVVALVVFLVGVLLLSDRIGERDFYEGEWAMLSTGVAMVVVPVAVWLFVIGHALHWPWIG